MKEKNIIHFNFHLYRYIPQPASGNTLLNEICTTFRLTRGYKNVYIPWMEKVAYLKYGDN
jgi:hypothetical protein